MTTKNLKIKELMDAPALEHDLPWLQKALQAAIELELSTLPPYLCGLYALGDEESDAAKIISKIVFDEMSHFGLTCNLALAAGAEPKVIEGYDAIQYPGQLPGGVRPKCDPELHFPCDPEFEVRLGFEDYQAFIRMCMQIEYPEDPVPIPRGLALEEAIETFPTIGAFYRAIHEAFEKLDAKIPYAGLAARQQASGFPKVFKITDLASAKLAIELIQHQGEGGAKTPFIEAGGMVLAHFYRFGEIYYGKKYVFDAAAMTGNWTGADVAVPAAVAMTPVPLGGYPDAPEEVKVCDRLFTKMLRELDAAWADGGAAALSDAIGSMVDLKSAILDLFSKKLARPEGGIYGPQFRKLEG